MTHYNQLHMPTDPNPYHGPLGSPTMPLSRVHSAEDNVWCSSDRATLQRVKPGHGRASLTTLAKISRSLRCLQRSERFRLMLLYDMTTHALVCS